MGGFVNYCISNQYFGVENLIGIPGWVGSAPVQNIGAYGVEVKDVIEKVEGVFIANKENLFSLLTIVNLDTVILFLRINLKIALLLLRLFLNYPKRVLYANLQGITRLFTK